MTPNKPYLIKAIYEWIIDNQFSPYVLVDTTLPNVQVPEEYIQEDKIVLNLSPQAIAGLVMNTEILQFATRFSGKEHYIFIPMGAILAIYAKENGQGMGFETYLQPTLSGSAVSSKKSAKNNKLSVIGSEIGEPSQHKDQPLTTADSTESKPSSTQVRKQKSQPKTVDNKQKIEKTTNRRQSPKLTVIKDEN